MSNDFDILHPRAVGGANGGQFVPKDSVRQEAGQIVDLGGDNPDLSDKGAIDAAPFVRGGAGAAPAKAWAASATAKGMTAERIGDRYTLHRNGRSLEVTSVASTASGAIVDAASEARRVETTWGPDEWSAGPDEYLGALERARALRDFMGPDDYRNIVCQDQDPTI